MTMFLSYPYWKEKRETLSPKCSLPTIHLPLFSPWMPLKECPLLPSFLPPIQSPLHLHSLVTWLQISQNCLIIKGLKQQLILPDLMTLGEDGESADCSSLHLVPGTWWSPQRKLSTIIIVMRMLIRNSCYPSALSSPREVFPNHTDTALLHGGTFFFFCRPCLPTYQSFYYVTHPRSRADCFVCMSFLPHTKYMWLKETFPALEMSS